MLVVKFRRALSFPQTLRHGRWTDDEIDGAVAAVLVIVAFELARLGRDRLAHLADELDRALVEADGRFGIEVEHIFHAGDIFAVDIAYQNKAAIYDMLFKASAEAMITIAADPKHLGVRIGFLSVLHSWGSALTHHPHVHMIVPGGGISCDGSKWVSCRPRYLLPVPVLSALFRRLFLEKLVAAHRAGELQFFGNHAPLTDTQAFAAYLAPLRNSKWVVYSKRPFGGPKEVLRYLARYTHRVAISNRRLLALDDNGVTFKWKDYASKGRERYKVMTLATTSSSVAS